jgi:hypothetical protein
MEMVKNKVRYSKPWDVFAYVNGELIGEKLLALALKQNKTLDDVKNELREHFPNVEFRPENI